jgi:hypothetical protein
MSLPTPRGTGEPRLTSSTLQGGNRTPGWQLYLALAGIALLYIFFAVSKATLGVDFTDEGLYAVAPLRLSLGEPLFSSEIMTLLRPAEFFSQVFLHLFASPTLYQLRLCGWAIHSAVYLVFFWVLYRECRSLIIAFLSSSISFFVSFAWPSTIATPSYKSLSTDFLLLFLCLFFTSHRRRSVPAIPLRLFAGLSLLVAVICYPSLVVLILFTLAYDIREFYRASGAPIRERLSLAGTSITVFSAGLLFFCYLCLSGAATYWLARMNLVHNSSLTAFKNGVSYFYGHLFLELFTQVTSFRYYSGLLVLLVCFVLVAKQSLLRKWKPYLLVIFQGCSLYTFSIQSRGHSDLENFSLPTAFCLLAVSSTVVYLLFEIRLSRPIDFLALFCVSMSLVGGLIYCASTYFFDYYYCWNNGLLALPFAFSLMLATNIGELCRDRKLRLVLAGAALLIPAHAAIRYDYYGVRRDSKVENLTTNFRIPSLRGIKSTPDRVASIESLYDYLRPQMAKGESLLAYDDCPMLYFIFKAKPAYGLAWALRYTMSVETLDELNREFNSQPLPRFAIRTMVDLSTIDWKKAPATNYDHYPLNESVLANYERVKTIFPFEVWELKSGQR